MICTILKFSKLEGWWEFLSRSSLFPETTYLGSFFFFFFFFLSYSILMIFCSLLFCFQDLKKTPRFISCRALCPDALKQFEDTGLKADRVHRTNRHKFQLAHNFVNKNKTKEFILILFLATLPPIRPTTTTKRKSAGRTILINQNST